MFSPLEQFELFHIFDAIKFVETNNMQNILLLKDIFDLFKLESLEGTLYDSSQTNLLTLKQFDFNFINNFLFIVLNDSNSISEDFFDIFVFNITQMIIETYLELENFSKVSWPEDIIDQQDRDLFFFDLIQDINLIETEKELFYFWVIKNENIFIFRPLFADNIPYFDTFTILNYWLLQLYYTNPEYFFLQFFIKIYMLQFDLCNTESLMIYNGFFIDFFLCFFVFLFYQFFFLFNDSSNNFLDTETFFLAISDFFLLSCIEQLYFLTFCVLQLFIFSKNKLIDLNLEILLENYIFNYYLYLDWQSAFNNLYFLKFYLNFLFNNLTLTLLLIIFCVSFFFNLLFFQNFFLFKKPILALTFYFNFIKNLLNDLLVSSQAKFYYFQLITLLSLFLLLINLFGLIPYTYVLTAQFSFTFLCAFLYFFSLNFTGIYLHGFGIFNLFFPSGAPIFIAPLLVIIEIISYFARVFSLSIRLFANITAGHILLKIISWFIFMLYNHIYASLIGSVIICVLWFLEFFISILQAYVFTILICIYLSDVLAFH